MKALTKWRVLVASAPALRGCLEFVSGDSWQEVKEGVQEALAGKAIATGQLWHLYSVLSAQVTCLGEVPRALPVLTQTPPLEMVLFPTTLQEWSFSQLSTPGGDLAPELLETTCL